MYLMGPRYYYKFWENRSKLNTFPEEIPSSLLVERSNGQT
jgi:hypothetical protein